MSNSPLALKRIHAQRLREVYRSAGWPYQDTVEIDLLAAGLLERVHADNGHAVVRLTDAGIAHLAAARQGNRQARSAHETLVDKVVELMLRDGRMAWTGLSLRAKVNAATPTLTPAPTPTLTLIPTTPTDTHPEVDAANDNPADSPYWKVCQPDVFSIRNSSRPEYLEPIVHEIKVSRADLLGDLRRPEKRRAYLEVGGQCWYVLGCDRSGHPIAKPNEIPIECGVMIFQNNQLEITRMAPKKMVNRLPFSVWMALAKSTPEKALELGGIQSALA